MNKAYDNPHPNPTGYFWMSACVRERRHAYTKTRTHTKATGKIGV